MYRLFVAIDFPEAVLSDIAGICHGVRRARWVPREQIHCTLSFIGDADEGQYHDIVDALGDISLSAFPITLSGTGFFPPRKPPRVLWVGVERCEALLELVSSVHHTLARIGVEPEKRKFIPHVTVARLRDRVAPADITPFLSGTSLFKAGPVKVTEFHLYSSVLKPEGALHRLEAGYQLL